MINQTSILIPYPLRLGFISINAKKRIDLSFDNLSLFCFREETKISTNEDLKKWQAEHGQYDLFIESVWAACMAWHIHKSKKFNLNKNKFALGFAQADIKELEKVTEVWKRSMTFGADKIPGKKKQVTD